MSELKKLILDSFDDKYFDIYSLLEKEIENWPNTPIPKKPVGVSDEDFQDMIEEFKDDPQDLENCEVHDITDDTITIICGGDWQSPMKIKIGYKNGQFKVIDAIPSSYKEGLSDSEIKKACLR